MTQLLLSTQTSDRKCSNCGTLIPPRHERKDTYCKKCRSEYSSNWWKKNPGREKIIRKARFEKLQEMDFVTCSTCELDLPPGMFTVNTHANCIDCHKIMIDNYKSANREAILVRDRKAKQKTKKKDRITFVKRTYGISEEEYRALLASQNDLCAICKRPETRAINGILTLCVDHCHTTGKVRALLCHRCNSAIGMLGDSVECLQAAIDYLNHHRSHP